MPMPPLTKEEKIRRFWKRVVKTDQQRGRKKHNHPDNQISLAREFGVDQAQISRVVNGQAWTHV